MRVLDKYLIEIFTKPKSIKKKRIVGCGVIGRVKNDRVEILLIQRSSEDMYPNVWELPRGSCEKRDVGSKNCIIREVKEETGLDIIPVLRLGQFDYYRNKNEKSECIVYLCKMKDQEQEVVISYEHKDFRWISTFGEASMLLHPDQLKFAHIVLTNRYNEIYTLPSFKTSRTNYQWE